MHADIRDCLARPLLALSHLLSDRHKRKDISRTSAVDPNPLNLDLDPECLSDLDLDPGLYHQF